MGITRLTGMFKKETKGEAIPFAELKAVIKEKIHSEEETIYKESEGLVKGIVKAVERLSEFLEELKEMEREEMYKKLDLIVKNAQRQFSDSLKNVIGRMHTDVRDYSGLKTFYGEMGDALGQMQKLNRVHGQSLYLAFGREMKAFSRNVNEIAVKFQVLGKVLQSEEKHLTQLRGIQERILALEEVEKEISAAEREDVRIQGEIEKLEKGIETLVREISSLEASEEYEKLKRMRERQGELSTMLKSVEGEIYNVLHPLDRDFRKFRRLVELGKVSFDLRVLERYEDLTEEFLREEAGYPQLKKIAEKMREAMEKGLVEEEGRKKGKVLEILKVVLEDGLREMQEKYHALRGELAATVVESDVTHKMEKARKDIEEKRKEIQELKTKREGFLTKKKNAEERVERIGEEIKERCSGIGLVVEK